MIEKCSKCGKEAIGGAVDYFNLKDITYYCQKHFDDVAYIKIEKDDLE